MLFEVQLSETRNTRDCKRHSSSASNVIRDRVHGEDGKSPLFKLACYLSQGGRENLIYGDPVVPVGFNSTLRAAVAPDYLISGLIGSVLHVYFHELGTSERRWYVELRILSDSSENGLPSQVSFMSQNEVPSLRIRFMKM